jgi:hypothetical protein
MKELSGYNRHQFWILTYYLKATTAYSLQNVVDDNSPDIRHLCKGKHEICESATMQPVKLEMRLIQKHHYNFSKNEES